ncbi:MAG: hypothetical protein OHK0053_20990 [Microscillaceae bacterium]
MFRYNSGIFSFASSLVMLALLTFGILRWIGMEAGSFLDWLIGIGTFAWLMTVVIVPWNIHFEARSVLNEAKISQEKQIEFDQSRLPFVRQLAVGALWLALGLHLVSALGLYALAWAKVSVVGYYGAGAALLLTFLRPSVRAYEYISARLYAIRQEIQYPYDNVATLKYDLEQAKTTLNNLEFLLSESEENSWRFQVNKTTQKTRQDLQNLSLQIQSWKEENQREHERLSKETHHAVAQLTEDGKFIDNLVEIIRFIKKV